MSSQLLALIITAFAMAVWQGINLALCVVTLARGQLISADKKIVTYMMIVSLMAFLAFGGLGTALLLMLEKLSLLL